ncbi:unnamed protein product [Durusdinium trenchii]|uniref:Uncharacterized protein n=1 Tax=Durusdinium trenchii TaxID=1381693 RepID=A0ABP0KBX7_9DINO
MGAEASVLFLPCEELTDWHLLEGHCQSCVQHHCVRLSFASLSRSELFQVWKGWATSVVRNLPSSRGALKVVLVLGTNDSLFTRNEILELCEALRGVTQRKMLIKYLRFAQLQGNNFNPDEGGVDELSADLLALNAWTDAPYYFYKRASQGFLAFSD